jgi:hypothetical protein
LAGAFRALAANKKVVDDQIRIINDLLFCM